MDKQQSQPGKCATSVREGQFDEEDLHNLMELIKLLARWDAELAAKGMSPCQYLHEENGNATTNQGPVKKKRRRRRKYICEE